MDAVPGLVGLGQQRYLWTGNDGRGYLGDVFCRRSSAVRVPLPREFEPGSSAERWTGEDSGAGKWRGGICFADQGPGRGMGLCAVKGHLWAGAREEGRSPSQGLAKFSDSDTSGWYVPYPVQSTTNRYVPMGMYLETPFGYVPVHVPPCRPCTMYLFGFESREQQQRPTIHPSIHPILCHPTPAHALPGTM